MAVTKIADIIVPAIFGPYVQQLTTLKSALVRSGALTPNPQMNANLAGGGLTFNTPSFKDLADDTDNISTDDDTSDATANKIGTSQEISVRLSRNQVWSSMDLAADLAGADPSQAIADRVANYWVGRLQAAFVATGTGLFADNAAAPGGSEHVQDDMTVDISDTVYTAGATDFSAEAFIDAIGTMGDSADELTVVMMHSTVFQRAQKNNLIDFIADAVNPDAVRIPFFLGRRVIVDDTLPNASSVFDTWMIGGGAFQLGVGTPKVPVETERLPVAGDGGGQDRIVSRVQWSIHPSGNKYAGTAASGGPTNAATSNNLAHAGSWERVFPERNQIKIARLITRES